MSTDYDCWHETEEHVTIDMVIKNLAVNSGHAKDLIRALLKKLDGERNCGCVEAARYSIVTAKEKMNGKQSSRLKKILPDYF